MKDVMQDSKFKIQTAPLASSRSLVCILHFAFCIDAGAAAQLQPGVPGQMGHQTGIVASNVPPQFKAVTFAQRLNQQMPLDTMLKDETGRDRHARRLLRAEAGGAGVRLLPVPDALSADAERHLVGR